MGAGQRPLPGRINVEIVGELKPESMGEFSGIRNQRPSKRLQRRRDHRWRHHALDHHQLNASQTNLDPTLVFGCDCYIMPVLPITDA